MMPNGLSSHIASAVASAASSTAPSATTRHQADAQRLVRLDPPAGEEDLRRVRRADRARQQIGDAELAAGQAVGDAGVGEVGRLARVPDVGAERETHAAADRGAVDRADHRLRERRSAGTTPPMYDIERIARREKPSPSMLGGRPRSCRSRPEQNARPAPVSTTTHVSLSAADLVERAVERLDERERHRVEPLGLVQRDHADVRTNPLDGDQLVGAHEGSSSGRGCRGRRGRPVRQYSP